jgi:hypothetical protein
MLSFCLLPDYREVAMNKLTYLLLFVFTLSGCYGEITFDSTSKESIAESKSIIIKALPEGEREDFLKAVQYFSHGGSTGAQELIFKLFASKLNEQDVKSEVEDAFLLNLQVIHGLSGKQVIKKHHSSLALAKSERDKEKARIAKEEAESLADQKAYFDKIEVTDFVAQRFNPDTVNEAGVRFGLKNNGSRTVYKVHVVVYFKDNEGNAIHEMNVFRPNALDTPLRPGYVYETPPYIYFGVDSPLADWAEGEASFEIVGIEFDDGW